MASRTFLCLDELLSQIIKGLRKISLLFGSFHSTHVHQYHFGKIVPKLIQTYSKNQIWLFKSFPEEKQAQVFQYLQNSEEKFRYYKSLSPEKRIALYKGLGSDSEAQNQEETQAYNYAYEQPLHVKQLSFFQSLEDAEQVKLYEELGIKDKAKVCKAIPSTDQSRIFNSLQQVDQVKLFDYLNPEERLTFFKYLEEKERLELYYKLSLEPRAHVFNGLPEEDRHLVQTYISLKKVKDGHIVFFKSLNESEQEILYNFLKEDEKKKLEAHLRVPLTLDTEVSSKAIPTDKSATWEAQFERFQRLKGLAEQAKFVMDLDGEDSLSLFRRIRTEEQQIELFKALGSDEQVALFTNLDSKEKARLYKSLPEKELDLLEKYIGSKKPDISFFTNLQEADQAKLYRLLGEEDQKRLDTYFNQSFTDLIDASKLRAEEAEREEGYRLFHAREEQMLQFNLLDDPEDRAEFFEALKDEDAHFLFVNIKNLELQLELFKSLEAEQQNRLFNALSPPDQEKVFIYLKQAQAQDQSFQTMSWEEKINFFRSLDWKEKIELFSILDPEAYTWLLYILEDQLELFNKLPNPKKHAFLDAMEHELAFLRQMHNSRNRWEAIKRSGEKVETDLEHFYSYQFHHPRFFQIIIVILGLFAMGISLNFTLQFFNKKAPEPIYKKVEGIKRLGEMHLVKQQYESVIPITKKRKNKEGDLKDEKLQFLLIAPIEVTGYIDFGKLALKVLKDSVMEIALPDPQISKAYLDFARTEEFRTEGKFRVFGQYIERMNHKQAYYDIAQGINDAKERVKKSAEREHLIKEETTEQAETFLRNFGSTLGYKVIFHVDTTSSDSPVTDTDEEKGFGARSKLSQFADSILNK